MCTSVPLYYLNSTTERGSLSTHDFWRTWVYHVRWYTTYFGLHSLKVLDSWWQTASKLSDLEMCSMCSNWAERAQQLVGQLPAPRVTPSSLFTHTGVNYAGPIILKNWNRRRIKTYKRWVYVFFCLSISAVYLGVISNFSSSEFITSLHQFTSPRGVCSALYGHWGTTFKGAKQEIKTLFTQGTQVLKNLVNHTTVNQVTWHFNSIAAPHMSGKWEAAVNYIKHDVTETVGKSLFTFEEFTTLLTQIEAVRNSRIPNRVEKTTLRKTTKNT